MFKKYLFVACLVFFLIVQRSDVHCIDMSSKLDESDISITARILRTSVIRWRCDEVTGLLNFYMKYFPGRLLDILSDTQTSAGNKTILQDLIYYRLQAMGEHKEILDTLVSAERFCRCGIDCYGKFSRIYISEKEITDKDVYVLAHILRTAVIRWSVSDVSSIINLYKKCFQSRLNDILYDLGTSLLGNKTIIEDLFCYRLQSNGNHQEILRMLIEAFRYSYFFKSLSVEEVNRQTISWILFNKLAFRYPSLVDCTVFTNIYTNMEYLFDLVQEFFECITELGGESIIDTSFNGRGCTVRQCILHQLPSSLVFSPAIKCN